MTSSVQLENPFNLLPLEIIKEILSQCDMKTLCRFGQTSKINSHYCEEFSKVNPLKIANRGDHTFLYNSSTLYCIGRNDFGQLGLGNTFDQHHFVENKALSGKGKIDQVYVGVSHTFIHLTNGKLFATGYNASGQLGLGHTLNQNYFEEILYLPKNSKIDNIYVGSNHTFIRLMNGKLFAAGYNASGQLGLHDNNYRAYFVETDNLSREGKIVQIYMGANHSFAHLTNDKLFVTGNNTYGQLGLGDTRDRNYFTEVIGLPKNTKIAKIYAGAYHTFIQFVDDRIFATGLNYNGQLGLGDTRDRNYFTEVIGLLKNNKIAKIYAGNGHTFICMTNGQLFTAGRNDFGQLGLGNTINQHYFVENKTLSERGEIYQIYTGMNHTIIYMTDGRIFLAGRNSSRLPGLSCTYNYLNFVEISHKIRYKNYHHPHTAVAVMLEKGDGVDRDIEAESRECSSKCVSMN